LLFDSKLTQLFEIFEYLFNRDQPGDWDAICLYFASHKPLPLNPVLCRVCVPTPPTPLTTHGSCCRRQVSTVTSDCVIMAGGKLSAWSVERWTFCQYCYGFNFNTETSCI